MRIKFLGTKVLIVLTTMLATPVVWAALAWPEWSSAAPQNDDVVAEQPVVQEPQVVIQEVIHRVVVVPRYVEVEATPGAYPIQPQGKAPVPANTPVPLPPASVPQAIIPPTQTKPEPVQQTTASGSGTGGGSTSSSSTSATSSGSSSPADTTSSTARNSQTSAPAPSNSKTKGS